MKEYNLIREKWIPIRRKNGLRERIAPWEISSDYRVNPVLEIDAPRPDFNGALIQFLIGLVQTAAAPEHEDDWIEAFSKPQGEEKLRAAFEKVAFAFDLAGEKGRFMQDFEPLQGDKWDVDALLIEAPGDQTKKKNMDLFAKRDRIHGLCISCCATALFTMQTNAPAGGAGVRTSLRGGGPLTTLILGDTLWETVWLNVLERDVFLSLCNREKSAPGDMFPWLAPTRTSEKGETVTSLEVHPAQMFWGMPRRIRLDLETFGEGSCDVCGAGAIRRIAGYHARPRGTNYSGRWRHPLTPYGKNSEGELLPAHGQPGGVYYRHWLGLVRNSGDENSRQSAGVVHHFFRGHYRSLQERPFRLWAFGYDMDNMKARCWYESIMPLYYVAEEVRPDFEHHAACLIDAATESGKNLRGALRRAWFKAETKVKGDMSFVDAAFWHSTEDAFYSLLDDGRGRLMQGGDLTVIRQGWPETLRREAMAVFDLHAMSVPIGHADPKRVALARRDLGRFFASNKLKYEILGLPLPASETADTGTGKSRKRKRSEV
ncbi:MAG: type I-E CRISPR-associated protein Cse1/CasA [Deltaproteobacteria bacterium]|nr:MAG: type I-E CRISPR-associated protein Cse1/CasA [Deltaproteobacteria bacterium]